MKIVVAIIVGILSSFNLVNQGLSPDLPSSQLTEDFKILKEHLIQYHPDLYLYTPKTTFDSLISDIENSLNQSMTEAEFYKKVLPLICSIRNAHTDLYRSAAYMNFLSEQANRFPLIFYFRDDSLFLFKNASEEYNIKEGSLITKINGQNAVDLIKKMAPLNTNDGYHTGNAFRRVSQTFTTYYALLEGTPNHFSIHYLNHLGQEQETTLKAILLNKVRENLRKRYPNHSPKPTSDYYITFNGNVATLRIRSFQPKRELIFYRFLKKAFKEIKAKNIQHLIIDVRENGGGFPESASRLLSYLVDEKIHTTKLAYALVPKLTAPNHFKKDGYYKHFNRKRLTQKGQYFHTNDAKKAIIKPRKPRFNGQVYILQNERSASATAEFLGLAATYTDAIFIGRESGSNPVTQVATDIVTLVLPHSKLRVRFPLIKTELNVNIKNKGFGLVPDYIIEPTIRQKLDRRDVIMEKALELMSKHH
jgi:hypothetical protein